MSNLQILHILTAKDTLIADDDKPEKYQEERNKMDYADKCYECTGYGDDYYVNEDGELVSNCGNCLYNKAESEGEE